MTSRVPLVVIGAGPHALSLVAKLLEESTDPLEETPENDRLFRTIKHCGSGPSSSSSSPGSGAAPGAAHQSVPRVAAPDSAAASERISASSAASVLGTPPSVSVDTIHNGSLLPDKIARSQPYGRVRKHFEAARRNGSERRQKLRAEDIVVLDRNGTWMKQ